MPRSQWQPEGDAGIRALAGKLTAGAKDDKEKVTAIRDYVIDNLYYSSLPLAESGYRIRPAAEVIRSAYGTEAEKANLMAALLKAAGLKAGIGVMVASIPVIAAGGIADNRGFNAAFALGAEAVQMGTRFVTAKESIVHENYKQKVIKAKDIDSEVTGMSTGHPIRVLRNKMTRQYLKLEKEGAPFEELEKMTLGALRKAVVEGDTSNT